MRQRPARARLAGLALAAVALTSAGTAAAQAPGTGAPRPNVVLVMMDDLGYGDLGSYGAPDVRTPNIDRLAREGVRLTQFYANGATCSPTRAGLISGRYQQRYGIEWPLGAMPGDSARGLAPAATSLPRLLESAGYATGLVGKWHLGWEPGFHPNRHGFDEFWGYLGGFVDYYNNVGAFRRHDLFHNDSAVHDTTYFTEQLTRRATGFIERHAGEPFFLEVSYNAVHWPFERPGLTGHEVAMHNGRDGTRADYVAMLESADRGVGAILATLERLQLSRNTLVIVTSDNGGEWLSRNAPLFHRKATLWEGGIRVPAILRWPGRLPAGVVSAQVGITMDLTATIVAAAGVAPPPSYRPEGLDLVPLLARRRAVERTLFWRVQNASRSQRAVRRGDLKYLRDGPNEFLFDVARDPGERHDLAAARAGLLPEFRQLVAAWEAEVGTPQLSAAH